MAAHEVDIHVGERIRARRRALGMTQQRLADTIGLTFQQVQKYERGANRVSASMLYAIARSLSTSIDHFFEGLESTDGGDSDDLPTIKTVQQLLAMPEGLALAQAFPKIDSPIVRRRILKLVEEIADD